MSEVEDQDRVVDLSSVERSGSDGRSAERANAASKLAQSKANYATSKIIKNLDVA